MSKEALKCFGEVIDAHVHKAIREIGSKSGGKFSDQHLILCQCKVACAAMSYRLFLRDGVLNADSFFCQYNIFLDNIKEAVDACA
jgi:hypothetical protein